MIAVGTKMTWKEVFFLELHPIQMRFITKINNEIEKEFLYSFRFTMTPALNSDIRFRTSSFMQFDIS